jgi:hypothetical protein
MTNVVWPILFYGYYNYGEGTLAKATPFMAATDLVETVTGTTPIYRNILVSNVTATATGGYPPVMIWGLPEMLISNVTLRAVNITAASGAKVCQIYNATGIQLADCKITLPANVTTWTLYNAHFGMTNSVPAANVVTLDGLTTNGLGNSMSFYNALASVKNTNALAAGPLTLGAGTFTISNNLTLYPATVFSFQPGINPATVAVKGNLTLGGTNNILASDSFTNGTYTLFTYTGSLSGAAPTLGTVPAGFNYAFDTTTVGQVNLIVTPLLPGIPANLTAQGTNLSIALQWSAAANASSYNLKRSMTNGGTYSTIANVTTTNYSDAPVNPGTTYYYVISATNSAGESADSIQVAAIPLPSMISTNVAYQVQGGQLQLSWPSDHTGWILQAQTNALGGGLGTNWVTVTGSASLNGVTNAINPANGSVYYRLISP